MSPVFFLGAKVMTSTQALVLREERLPVSLIGTAAANSIWDPLTFLPTNPTEQKKRTRSTWFPRPRVPRLLVFFAWEGSRVVELVLIYSGIARGWERIYLHRDMCVSHGTVAWPSPIVPNALMPSSRVWRGHDGRPTTEGEKILLPAPPLPQHRLLRIGRRAGTKRQTDPLRFLRFPTSRTPERWTRSKFCFQTTIFP
jgi:hypothetical protein